MYRVKSWKDCHGIETFFRVMDGNGNEYGRYASEWEAQAKAKAFNQQPEMADEAARVKPWA